MNNWTISFLLLFEWNIFLFIIIILFVFLSVFLFMSLVSGLYSSLPHAYGHLVIVN